MSFVLASQLRNVKVENKKKFFFEILGLEVPGSQRKYFSGSRNTSLFLNLSLLFSIVGEQQSPRATTAPNDVGQKPLGTEFHF